MKNIKYFSAIILLLSSCSEDILDLSPLDSVSESIVWEDQNLIELYVNDRYNELPHGFCKWAGGLRMTGLTDESYHMHEPKVFKYTNGEVTADNMYFYAGFWSDAYEAIRNANIFLEKINPEVGDSSRIKQLVAEVRFIRAYFYAELISRYNGVPIIKKPFSLDDDFNVPRSGFDEVVQFIVSELDLAIPDLLSRAEATGEDFGRVTKGAAIGLKARTLLYAASPLFSETEDPAKWEAVADACEELFDLEEYQLSDNYPGMFLDPMDPEIIFFKQFIDQYGEVIVDKPGDYYYHYTGGHRIDEWRFPNGSGGWVSENPLQNFVDQYETLSGEVPVIGYTGNSDSLTPVLNPAAMDYDPDHPYDNRDPRLAYSVYYDGATFKGRELEMWWTGLDSRDPNVDWWWNGSRLGYGIRKSLDESWSYTSMVGSDQPWIYMRLAEFYLTYAEAQYHLGEEATAIEYVNRVRSRTGVNMPAIAASGEELLERIKHERKIELAFEGNRWYDARRWKDAETDFSRNV
ncbi:MAG: RagB/SusD family nutrient uptake outer membrane protein, partial [Bacteroidales bacterium]